MLDPGYLTDLAGLLQSLKEPIALRVHIRRDMMGHLAGGMLKPTLASYVSAPIHNGRPVASTSAERQKRM